MQKITIEPISNKKQYEKALQKIESLIDCKQGSQEEQYLEAISMEQEGLSQQDIAKYFGGKNRASEVLNGKRKLTLKMVKSLYNNLQIPAEVLLAN